MPTLSHHQSFETTKMLFVGDSGSGKTGALASLVKAGYELVIADMDNGLDILRSLLTNEELERVHFQTFTDQLKSIEGKVVPKGNPTAWPELLKNLDNWKDEDETLGPISDWEHPRVFVLDSMTLAGLAALRWQLHMNGRSGQQPWQSDWGEAMDKLEKMLQLLYSDAVRCHVIVTSHVTYLESEEGQMTRGLPMALGSKLPPKVPRYFNTVVLARTQGSGSAAKHKIFTRSQGIVELKNAAPGKMPPDLPLETGLATIFKTLQGR